MQTPDRYWEGLFWDGFAPEAIGAVALATAKPKTESAQSLLELTKKQIEERKFKVFFSYSPLSLGVQCCAVGLLCVV